MSPIELPRLPKWLPEPAQNLLQDEYSLGKKRGLNILPAFLDPQMQPVWKKIAALSENAVIEYSLVICDTEENFNASMAEINLARQDAKALKSLCSRAMTLNRFIQQKAGHSPWWEKVEDSSKNLTELLLRNQEYAEAISQEIYPTFAQYSTLTRKKAGREALITFFIRSLSNMIRGHTFRSLNNEIATTVNVLFGTTLTGDHVKKLVKSHPKKGKIRAQK